MQSRFVAILGSVALLTTTTARAEPPPGVVQLHIETSAPTIELRIFDGWSAPRGYARRRTEVREVPIGRLVCAAPCDTWIDGREGYQYFFTGPGLMPSSFFRLTDQTGPLVAHVQAGERGTHDDGVLVSALGGFGLGVGTLLFVGGLIATGSDNADWRGDAGALKVAGGVTFGLGAAALITGLVILVRGSTRYSFAPPAALPTARGM